MIYLCGHELTKAKIRLNLPELDNKTAIISLIVIIASAIFLRTINAIPNVLQNGSVMFLETDAYYHMGAVDTILNNPEGLSFPAIIFQQLSNHRLMALMIAATSWIIGLGNPSYYLADNVGAVFPVIGAVGVIVMVYIVASRLFGRWVALISCAFVAIIPSEFLHRSLFGFTDQHVFEVLYTLVFIHLLVIAVESTGKKQMLYFTLSGTAITLYMLNWEGGLFIIFLAVLYWLIQTVYMIFAKQGYMRFTIGITIMIATAFICITPFQTRPLLTVYMLIIAVIPIVISTIIYLYQHGKRTLASVMVLTIIFPLFFVSNTAIYLYAAYHFGGWISEEIYHLYNPSVVVWPFLMIANFFTPDMLISETQPLLFPGGVFDIRMAWANFQWFFFLQFGALGYLIARYRMGLNHFTLAFIVWFCLMFIATMCLRRYAYYLTIPTAVFSVLFLYEVIRRIRFKKLPIYAVSAFTMGLFLFMSAVPALQVSSIHQGQITTDWEDSLKWLKGEAYTGNIVAWGDYGHWINRITDGKALYTPGVTGTEIAELIIYDGDDATGKLDALNAQYMVIDNQVIGSKFHAAISTCGLPQSNFYGIFPYWQEVDSKAELKQVILYFPRYYQSLAVQLYYYDCEYSPPDVPVYWFKKTTINGKVVNLITGVQRFSTVEIASEVIAKSGNIGMIASEYPSYSPIPQHDIPGIEIVHQTSTVKIAKRA